MRRLLLCDDDHLHADALAHGMHELGFCVHLVRSYADAFASACAIDFDALVVAPFLRDGSALALPSALGIRKPALVVLASSMTERLDTAVIRRVGFDAQLIKVVDPSALESLLRAPVETTFARASATKTR